MWESKIVYRGANQWVILHLHANIQTSNSQAEVRTPATEEKKKKGSDFNTGPLY